jgi:hypothetical protein
MRKGDVIDGDLDFHQLRLMRFYADPRVIIRATSVFELVTTARLRAAKMLGPIKDRRIVSKEHLNQNLANTTWKISNGRTSGCEFAQNSSHEDPPFIVYAFRSLANEIWFLRM